MAKGTRVRDQDKFMLRLPDGMRDRIKTKAERAGMSMNEAIVWVLERSFPLQVTLEDRIGELARAVAQLKNGNELEPAIDAIVDDIDTTLRDVAYGKIGAAKSFKDRVSRIVEDWEMEALEDSKNDPFLDANYPESDVPPLENRGKAASER